MAATGSKAPLVSVQIWPRCTARRKIIVRCGVIGVDAAKEALYARLKIIEAGAGFPMVDQYDLGHLDNSPPRRAVYGAARGSPIASGPRRPARGTRRWMHAVMRMQLCNRFE